jgi:hypothetical protein
MIRLLLAIIILLLTMLHFAVYSTEKLETICKKQNVMEYKSCMLEVTK